MIASRPSSFIPFFTRLTHFTNVLELLYSPAITWRSQITAGLSQKHHIRGSILTVTRRNYSDADSSEMGTELKSGGKAFGDFPKVQAFDGDELAAAGPALNNGYGGLFYTHYLAEEVGQLPVGLALLRRRSDFYLEDAAGKTGDFGTAGAWMDFDL